MQKTLREYNREGHPEVIKNNTHDMINDVGLYCINYTNDVYKLLLSEINELKQEIQKLKEKK